MPSLPPFPEPPRGRQCGSRPAAARRHVGAPHAADAVPAAAAAACKVTEGQGGCWLLPERRRQAAAAAGAGAGEPAPAARRAAHLGKADSPACVLWAAAWPPSVAGELRASVIAWRRQPIPPPAVSDGVQDRQLSRQRPCASQGRHRRGALVRACPALWLAEPRLQGGLAHTNEAPRPASERMHGWMGHAALSGQRRPPLPLLPLARECRPILQTAWPVAYSLHQLVSGATALSTCRACTVRPRYCRQTSCRPVVGISAQMQQQHRVRRSTSTFPTVATAASGLQSTAACISSGPTPQRPTCNAPHVHPLDYHPCLPCPQTP